MEDEAMRMCGGMSLAVMVVCFVGCKNGFSWGGVTSSSQAEEPIAEQARLPIPPMSERGDFITTDTGLKYRILRKATGRSARPSETALCHYKGWLDNGEVFDTSYKKNKPVPLPIRGVVPGFGEGLQLVGKGGAIELIIPSILGYGSRGTPGIPKNSTLHFEIEVIDVY